MPKKKMDTGLQYVAYVRKGPRGFHIEFPDVPGCEGTIADEGKVYAKAASMLDRRLREQIAGDEIPSWPEMHRPPASDQRRVHVTPAPALALAVQFRRMRREKAWTQKDLAERVGVTQQQIAKLEDPDGNPTVETISKVAKVFDRPLMVVFA
jgi:DNA-binding XRE family transcriptional regulator